MRSAVKAKLIELGTNYDELLDYVMIMVANKRSKQHMTDDLNEFLGSNTDPFVGWLHQVLQKRKAKFHLRSLKSEESEDYDFVNIDDSDDFDILLSDLSESQNETKSDSSLEHGAKTKKSIMERLGVKSTASANSENVTDLRELLEKRKNVKENIEEYVDTAIPVNSVIRVKRQPIIPSNKQESKNLLLKAVAEAQKSVVKPRSESPVHSATAGLSQKLFTKSFRDNNSLMRKGKTNIDDGAYVPEDVNAEISDEEIKRYIHQPSTDQTKFVCTLNPDNYILSGESKSIESQRVDRERAVINKEIERTFRGDITTPRINQSIIKNDTEDEEELRREVIRSIIRKRSRSSTIKFDLTDAKRSKIRDDHITHDNIGGDGGDGGL